MSDAALLSPHHPFRRAGPWRDPAGRERLAIKAALALAFGMLLALIEPFGFEADGAAGRLIFWTTMMAAWFVLFGLVGLALSAGGPRTLSPRGQYVFRLALTLVPILVFSTWMAKGAVGWTTTAAFVDHVAKVLVVTLGFEFVCHLIQAGQAGGGGAGATPTTGSDPADVWPNGPARTPAHRPGSAAGPGAQPALANRLPFSLRGEILCLQMEDHYVRIHTPRGSTLVLMRFSDALAELDGANGLRIHRSWWVAAAAVESVRRSPRSTQVELVNGLIAPVSQPYVQAVKALAQSALPAPTGPRAPSLREGEAVSRTPPSLARPACAGPLVAVAAGPSPAPHLRFDGGFTADFGACTADFGAWQVSA